MKARLFGGRHTAGSLLLLATLTIIATFALTTVASAARHWVLYKHDVLHRVETGERVVALTFDDGPDSRFTHAVLDRLSEYEATATFFVVGECVEDSPEVASRILTDGHEIGNHTQTHPMMREIAPRRIQQEIDLANRTISEACGVEPVWYRPPRRQATLTGKIEALPRLLEGLADRGFRVVSLSELVATSR